MQLGMRETRGERKHKDCRVNKKDLSERHLCAKYITPARQVAFNV